jgi:hypothetical protein
MCGMPLNLEQHASDSTTLPLHYFDPSADSNVTNFDQSHAASVDIT